MTDNSRLIGPFSISTGNGASGWDGVVRATNIYSLHTHTTVILKIMFINYV